MQLETELRVPLSLEKLAVISLESVMSQAIEIIKLED